MEEWRRELLSQIPSTHRLLERVVERTTIPRPLLHKAVDQILTSLRREVLSLMEKKEELPLKGEALEQRILQEGEEMYISLSRVINATGILLHTNLGRAPLSREARERVASLGGSYMNLEFNLHTGERGSRYHHVKELLCQLTGAQDALIVNNNAAAVLLVLDTLAKDREVVVSRGELIEIGGSFRLPALMEKASVRLVEVGTTNRTSLNDYLEVLGEETALILKSHQSNYRIMGFTREVTIGQLVKVAEEHGLPFYYDMGSGNLLPFHGEPTVKEVITRGVPLLSFSGDKLLGGPQAGILVGERDFIEDLRKNQLTRALRVGKMTLLALEETLKHYLHQETEKIPLYRALSTSMEIFEERGERIKEALRDRDHLYIEMVKGEGEMGGGSLPLVKLESRQLHITSTLHSAEEMKRRLLIHTPPIVSRITEERLILDLLTIGDEEIEETIEGLKGL